MLIKNSCNMFSKILSFVVENIYNFLDKFHTRRLKNFYRKRFFDLVIDVGSHKGEFIKKVIKKEIPIYSFEPQSQVRRILKKNTFNYNVIKYYDYALSNYEGFTDLYLNSMSSTSTTKKVDLSKKWVRFKNLILGGNIFSEIEKVKVNTLDNLLINDLGLKKILLKIDVEGGEAEVLEGSQEILKKCNVVLVQIESSNYKIYKNNLNPENLLLNYGFRLERKFIFPLRNFTDLVFSRDEIVF